MSVTFSFEAAIQYNNSEVIVPIQNTTTQDLALSMNHSTCDGYQELSMTVRNISDQPIHLDRLVLLRTSDLKLDTLPSPDWFFFRQGRLKNELPAVCRLGDMGEAFADARATLHESGGGLEDSDNTPLLVSDSMTLISGGDNSPVNILLTFETGDRLLVETLLQLTEDHHFESLECACIANIILEPGMSLTSETLRIAFPEDPIAAIDAFAQRKAARYHARKNEHTPSVYCTWYYYGLTVTEADVMENLIGLQKRNVPFDVYQVDEGWEITLGDWRPNAKFPSGMKYVADQIRTAGMVAGIWTSPFIAHETAPVTTEHPEWFLKHPDGSWCLFPMNDTVYRVLDVTNPDAVAWAADLYRQLREYGYRYHKLDFTRAAVLYPDAPRHRMDIPIAQAYRAAVQALRREMGEDAYFLMCGGLYDPLIGVVNGQRSGSDVLSMWSAKIGGGGGRTAPFTIKQNLLRYWMNSWWDADPDALMVRRQLEPFRDQNLTYGLLTEDETRTSVLNQFMGCGIACSTEPMSTIEDDRLYVLRHILPVLPGVPHPRDLFSGERYPSLVDLTYPNYHMVCVINWSDTETIPCTIKLDSNLLGDFADCAEEFTVCSFWEQNYREHVPAGSEITMGTIAPHGTALLKIIPQTAAPVIVTSNAHFSMGAELDCLEIKDGILHFALNQKFPCPARYGIKLPAGLHPAALPAGTAYFNGLLEIYVSGLGQYDITLPLAEDLKL